MLAGAMPDMVPAAREKLINALRFAKQRRQALGPQKSPVERAEEKRQAANAKLSLKAFVGMTWHMVEPDRPLSWNWHLEVLCWLLERVTRGEIKKLLINVPPGTMKSLLVSVFWPAWEWANNPKLRYLTGSYSDSLTIRDNLRLREIITSPWYRRHFSLRLKGDQNEKVRFNTTANGWRIATSVGGKGTGEHPDRVIVDDPHTAEQAQSELERKRAIRWFKRTISTRGKSRDVRTVVIMQRLHEEDLSGHLIARGGWFHVKWPMRYVKSKPDDARWKPDPLDPRTEPGELLWPALFPEQAVRELEIDLDPYGAAGQLQQEPAPEGGGLFQSAWFEIVDAIPAFGMDCRGWDIAATPGGGDWTVGVKMRRVGPTFYVLDVVRGQWGDAEVEQQIAQTAVLDSRSCRVREEQEPGSSGKAVIADRARLLVGFDYKAATTSGNKVTRARPYRAQAEAGNVKLLRAEWNHVYLQELSVFPTGAHDDQVDASSTAFNELATGPAAVKAKQAVW